MMLGKILEYDVETLEFLNEYKPNIEGLDFCFFNDNNDIAWYNTTDIVYNSQPLPFHIITTNKNYSILKKAIPVEFPTGYILNPKSTFFQAESHTLFSHPYNGVVYQLSSDGINELLTLRFQQHKFPTTNYLNEIDHKGNFILEIRNSDYINFFETFESENHYCFNLYASNTYFMGIHDKNNKQNIYFPVNRVIENNSFENAITDDIGVLVFNNPLLCYKNSYYSLISPFSILEKKEIYDGILNERIQEIINDINENDNPILLKYKLK